MDDAGQQSTQQTLDVKVRGCPSTPDSCDLTLSQPTDFVDLTGSQYNTQISEIEVGPLVHTRGPPPTFTKEEIEVRFRVWCEALGLSNLLVEGDGNCWLYAIFAAYGLHVCESGCEDLWEAGNSARIQIACYNGLSLLSDPLTADESDWLKRIACCVALPANASENVLDRELRDGKARLQERLVGDKRFWEKMRMHSKDYWSNHELVHLLVVYINRDRPEWVTKRPLVVVSLHNQGHNNYAFNFQVYSPVRSLAVQSRKEIAGRSNHTTWSQAVSSLQAIWEKLGNQGLMCPETWAAYAFYLDNHFTGLLTKETLLALGLTRRPSNSEELPGRCPSKV
jgi:hypothetical protein